MKRKILKDKKELELIKVDFIKKFKKLEKHSSRNIDTKHINKKVYYLLHDEYTFVNAYAKISKNKGALTKGIASDEEVIKFFGKSTAKNISEKFLKETYTWKPSRRTWIPKPGKSSLRPIDTPTQEDRISQEAIRGILEAIYEPEFKEFENLTKGLSNNFGFRPNKSTWSALENIKNRSRRTNICIEGDIAGAYNNVNHNKLLNILSKRIHDKKFLKCIHSLLQSGIMDKNQFTHNLNGTPQGGIVSPLLFNIYMFEFDKYIYYNIIVPYLLGNLHKNDNHSNKYQILRYNTKKLINQWKNSNKNYDDKIRFFLPFKKSRRKLLSTPSVDIENTPKGIVFTRYADDWVLCFTGNNREALLLKHKISFFLENHLELQLDVDKTKINSLTKGIEFLGYFFYMNSPKNIKLTRVLFNKNDPNKKVIRTLKRTTSRTQYVVPSRERIRRNLILKGFCNPKTLRPIAKRSWILFDEYEIILKYKRIIIGLANYYRNCDKHYNLNFAIYILQYSCAMTISTRRKTTCLKVFLDLGYNLIKKKQFLIKKKIITKSISLDLYKDLKSQGRLTYKKQMITDHDPFYIINFWRTKLKIYQECCICGETEGIALHHLNSIRSIKSDKDKFSYLRSQSSRLQIPVCKNCHHDITHGKYSDSTKPIEYYNKFILTL